jgi:hypothetical protein
MSAREHIEQTILAREEPDGWTAPENDPALLRSELDGCQRLIQNLRRQVDQLRLELERASDGEAQCAGAFAGYVLAVERLTQWISDGDNVTVSGSVLADLLADMVEAAGAA